MALSAGRVGVKKDNVDWQGNVKPSKEVETLTGEVETLTGEVETLTGEVETLTGDVETITDNIGGLEFRSSEGKGQYKLPNTEEWVNFSEGGDIGINIPADIALIPTKGSSTRISDVTGKYCIVTDDNNVTTIYMDISFKVLNVTSEVTTTSNIAVLELPNYEWLSTLSMSIAGVATEITGSRYDTSISLGASASNNPTKITINTKLLNSSNSNRVYRYVGALIFNNGWIRRI